MLFNCLLKDDHSTCVKVLGDEAPCHLAKQARDRLNKCIDPETTNCEALYSWMPFKLDKDNKPDFTDNPYRMQEKMERRLIKAGFQPQALSANDEWEVEEEVEEEEEEGLEEGEVYANGMDGTIDHYQPVPTVLTHPIAISCLIEYLQDTKVESNITRNVECGSTCFVESLHHTYLTYRPKKKHFHHTHNARIYLGALDWDENITREQVMAKKTKRKRAATQKTFKFMDQVVDRGLGKGCWGTPLVVDSPSSVLA